jgi:hypothetical protein
MWTLKHRALAAQQEATTLWLTIGVAMGMGGYPPPDAEGRLASACDTAQRCTLEWMAAQ